MLIILAVILVVGCSLLSAALTFIVRKFSLHTGFVAHPVRDRYHQQVMPLGGGIAIFATIAAAITVAILIVKFIAAPGYMNWLGESVTIHIEGFLKKIDQLLILLICTAILFALGLWDDKKNLGPYFKLIVQFAVAAAVVSFADIRVEFFIHSKLVTSVLSAVWIVLIINVFNFLDNMDGASAGIAVIVTCILFTAAALSGQVFVGAMTLIFIGALLGFLAFNFPPAKIFMGDCGSLVIGFFIAVLTLRTTYYHQV